jgi:hypothetical protein
MGGVDKVCGDILCRIGGRGCDTIQVEIEGMFVKLGDYTT